MSPMKAQPIAPPFSLTSYPFQRNASRLRLKKVNKKTRLTLKHVLVFLILAGGLVYTCSRLFLFLTTWEELNVRSVIIITKHETIRQELSAVISQMNLGNILTLNLKKIESSALTNRWVKKAKIRKIFPASLEITVVERQPFAVVKAGLQSYLIDEEGVKLDYVTPEEEVNYPQIILPSDSQLLTPERLSLVRDFLRVLEPAEVLKWRIIPLSPPANLVAECTASSTRIIFGQNNFPEKLELYRRYHTWLEQNFGPLEYIDLRFYEDRIYFQPKPANQEILPAGLTEEEL